jgi:hypothetical protein
MSSLRLILRVFKFKPSVMYWQKTVYSHQVLAQRWTLVKCKQDLLYLQKEKFNGGRKRE